MKNAMLIILAMIMTTAMLYGEASGQAPPVPAEELPEVLTRGPVNEAFAQPVNLGNQAGFIAPIEPPPDIEEIPPAERPAGDQFAWIPGYWAWDTDREDYVWVSGCWRAVPPDMYWVPGYWVRAGAGWQWVAGFWAPVSNREIEYLPEPPALTQVEPPGPAYSPNMIWVPPCWYWYHGRYVQRAGYWIEAQADWVWVPSHYVWTPRGYVFVSGHWDYTLDRRGILFAPVYFPRHLYERRGYAYPLSIVINTGYLEFGMFTYPRYSHYYFGDYYDSSYLRIGIFPWFEYTSRHTWYDPIYAHRRWWHHRHNEPQWDQHQRREYDRRRSDRSLRPSRTYREMEKRIRNMPEPRRRDYEIASPIVTNISKKGPYTFERTKPEARRDIPKRSVEIRKFVEERRQWEGQGIVRKNNKAVIQRTPSVHDNEMIVPPRGGKPEIRPSERNRYVPPGRTDQGAWSGRNPKSTAPRQQVPTKSAPPAIKWKQDNKAVRTLPETGRGSEMVPVQRSRTPSAPSRSISKSMGKGRTGTQTAPQPQIVVPPKTALPQYNQDQEDKVEVRPSPMVEKQGFGSRLTKPPANPTQEQKGQRGSKGYRY